MVYDRKFGLQTFESLKNCMWLLGVAMSAANGSRRPRLELWSVCVQSAALLLLPALEHLLRNRGRLLIPRCRSVIAAFTIRNLRRRKCGRRVLLRMLLHVLLCVLLARGKDRGAARLLRLRRGVLRQCLLARCLTGRPRFGSLAHLRTRSRQSSLGRGRRGQGPVSRQRYRRLWDSWRLPGSFRGLMAPTVPDSVRH